ncbi:hypothetical protein [Enterobacter hormaechei]|uniref:hypothetical protein n=1 Tax=Enterobacter hormaechei TaxID=158836 RepID=UPI0015EC7A38|nr:hypothetical protein [Enterobacter hormaechei]
MDESRKAFEQWALEVMQFTPDELTWDEKRNCYRDYVPHMAWKGWQASREEIAKGSIVAYQDFYDNAISAGDFEGGEDEMHETAFKEGWTPLVCAAGIKVKE